MGPDLPVAVDLPKRGSRRLVRSLHAQLRAAIVESRLKPGLRLPSSRDLAKQCRVSRNCVVAVYDLLLSEGYLTARPRGGTYVAGGAVRPRRAATDARESAGRLATRWQGEPPIAARPPSAEIELDFGVGLPDKAAFPFDVWRRLSARALRALSRTPAAYAEPEGRAPLRDAIARHVSLVRAVACDAGDVVVTSGAQQAFDLLAKILVTPGKTAVAVEDPGYPPLRAAFLSYGATLVHVPVDAEGIVVDRIPESARVICVTPSHQFPMGCAMSMRRRAELLELARRTRAVVIEDDYDGEFSHTGRPLDALKTLDRLQSVFYVGTFSKSMFPALRLGFVVAPAWSRAALVAAKQTADWHAALLPQDTLAMFMSEGHLARHTRKMRSSYRQRRDLLLEGVARSFGPNAEIAPAEAGLHVTVLLREGPDAEDLSRAAADARIRVHSIARYSTSRRPPNGLVLGLGMIEPQRIAPGLDWLARLRRSVGSVRPGSRRR